MNQTVRNGLFGIGAVGILLGAVLWFIGVEMAPYVFAVGAAGYAICQLTMRIDGKDLHARRMHRFQSIAALLIGIHMDSLYKEVFEGAMVCLICPTATAAAVITGKLGGSASSLTTYTLLSNLLAAIAVPLLFPLVEPHADLTFLSAFLKILSKVFPLLLFPFFLAMLFRYYLPAVRRFLLGFHDLAFYLWGVSLAIVTGQTVRSLVVSDAPVGVEILIALAGSVACAVQFYLGKRIGTRYDDRISAGQALGQKNTVLAIWMANTYLDPVSSVGPGSYVLWQNAFNSWQLWKKRKREAAAQSNNS